MRDEHRNLKTKLRSRATSKQRPSAKSTEATESLAALLTELASVLMTAGIGAAEFEKASRIGFVRAAARVARLGNSRVNQSAVAAMTGLTRSEVRKISTAKVDRSQSANARQRALRVVDGWKVDPAYLSNKSIPRVLSLKAGRHGFNELVRKYSGDIPPKAILNELLRLGLVAVRTESVLLRRVRPDTHSLHQLQSLISTLTPILTSLGASGSAQKRLVARELSLSVPDGKAHRLLQRQLDEAIHSFFISLQSAAEGASLPRRQVQSGVRDTHVCVLISD